MSEDMTPEGFKNFEDLLKKIEETLSRHSKKTKEQKMEDKNKNDMVWFSMSPDMDFVSSSPTEWNDTNTPKVKAGEQHIPQISPDLAHFMAEAGMLFYDALYMPFRTGKGRLTEFFDWIERARDRMEQEDFASADREAFTNWCRSIAETLLKAQTKYGLWLTDDEEDLVCAMSKGIFTDGDHGGGL